MFNAFDVTEDDLLWQIAEDKYNERFCEEK
jgi:hypothetical protein